MRKIDFRAWHREKQMMFEVIAVGVMDGWVDVMPAPDSSWVTNLDDVELMQFTGLKDKNGVEIYEGDILQSQNWACLCIVEWRDGGFVLPQGESTNVLGYELSCLYEEYPDTTVKVIGNIYQNPELLQS